MTDYAIALSTLKQVDPVLANLIDQIGDCTLEQVQQPGDLLFSLSRSMISQQLSVKAAKAIHTRFLKLYGGTPTPEAILDTPDEQLRSVGLSRSKILYMKDLAQQTLNGLPTITELETLEDEEIIQTLTKIKGIGRWTVEMLLIFRLHRWDVLPADDLAIRSSIRRAYQLDQLPDKKRSPELGKSGSPIERSQLGIYGEA